MLHRLVCDNMLSNDIADEYKSVTVSTVAAKLGYDKELYFPTNKINNILQQVNIFEKVEKMAEEDLISNGKEKNCC